jgi:hypothetical protein
VACTQIWMEKNALVRLCIEDYREGVLLSVEPVSVFFSWRTIAPAHSSTH